MYWEDEPLQEHSRAEEEPLREDGTRARLRMAQRVLFRAMVRLKVMQREHCDRAELGRAEAAYRDAEAELRGAWSAWRGEMRTKMAAEGAVEAERRAAAGVTHFEDAQTEPEPAALPKLRFARWLVQRGMLSEWPEQ